MKSTKETVATPVGDVDVITLTNSHGHSVKLSGLGACVMEIKVPDRNGRLADVVIGYPDVASYMADGPCAGKIPGRYANRIAFGRFSIDGKEYQLPANQGRHHLHGGHDGFQNKVWKAEQTAPGQVRFTLHSPDGEMGYPGNLDVTATYTWDDNASLNLDIEAHTDAPTVANLTNHTYFNLGGHDSGARRAMNQVLRMACSRWLVTDDELIPTGQIAPVAGTPMDFTEAHAVGRDIFPADAVPATESLIADFDAVRFGKGYDNCWVVDNADSQVRPVAWLSDPESGRMVTIESNQPAAQVYCGNWLSGCPTGKDGYDYPDYAAVAIECQAFPDAPNHPNFPSTLVTPEVPFRRTIRFTFSAE